LKWCGGFQYRGLLAPIPAAPFYSARGPAACAVQAPPSKPVPAHRRTTPAIAIGCCLNKKATELRPSGSSALTATLPLLIGTARCASNYLQTASGHRCPERDVALGPPSTSGRLIIRSCVASSYYEYHCAAFLTP